MIPTELPQLLHHVGFQIRRVMAKLNSVTDIIQEPDESFEEVEIAESVDFSDDDNPID